MNWKSTLGLILLVAGLAVGALKLAHVYDPAPAAERLSANLAAKASPKVAKAIQRVPAGRASYALLIILPAGLGAVLLLTSYKPKPKPLKTAATPEAGAKAPAGPGPAAARQIAVRPAKAKARKAAIHACNVLDVRPEAQQLWQFDARNGGFVLSREQTSFPGEPLPRKLVGRNWRSLFRRKLNVAWLPSEHVFLRVAQLPLSEFQETVAMVELQLEKLSPMPVAQIVWSIHPLSHAAGNMQAVVVIIAARDAVEEFLGRLEGQGYLADRLELPLLDQLNATAITADGAWIYPDGLGVKNTGLAAWWYGGVLQNLALVTLPPDNRPAALREQLMQMAWAGELEGWLTAPARWHLVASAAAAAEWGPPLREGLEQPLEVFQPLPQPELAAMTAKRAAQADPNVNLLPTEFATRYQQQFVDRLWMRGLLAVGALYVVGVVIYLAALQFLLFRTRAVEAEVADRGPAYTNAIQLKARLQVLTDRQNLKYAALDCWKTVAEQMPEGLTLEGWNFTDGRKLSLNGTVPADQVQQLVDNFYPAMRKAPRDKDRLFDTSKPGENLNYSQITPGNYRWSFALELKRTEAP
jgi:hypothetical protein